MTGFSLDLGSLPAGASHVTLEAGAADLGLPESVWPRVVVGNLRIERNGDRVSIRGTLETVADLECARCLKPYSLAVRVPFDVFADRAGLGSPAEEQELERGDYMKFHDGKHLDVREEARETLLVELPIAPRCSEACQGLCTQCGADLNLGPCGCPVEETPKGSDNPFRQIGR